VGRIRSGVRVSASFQKKFPAWFCPSKKRRGLRLGEGVSYRKERLQSAVLRMFACSVQFRGAQAMSRAGHVSVPGNRQRTRL